MDDAILRHFHPDERPFAVKTADWLDRIVQRHEVKRTDFLDPRQAHIVETLVRRRGDINALWHGGYEQAERKRAVLTPEYMTPDPDEAGIGLIAISSDDDRIADLDHGDYLGALLGLGLKRDKLGDLHVTREGCQCLIAEELLDFVSLHLHQVHRVHVSTSIVPLHELVPVVPKLETMQFTVASLRLDGIVADVWRLSRAKAVVPIKAGRCRVNWKTTEDPSCPLRAGDTVSLKGFGRFVVNAVEGETKKGRLRLNIAKYV